jgi:hypothetical protein
LNDFLIGAVSAAGSILSGAVFAAAGYAWMAALGGVVAAILLAATAGLGPRSPRAAVPA